MGGKPAGAQRLLEGVAAPRFRPYERRETFQPTSQALRLQPASHIRRGLTLKEPSKPRTWRLHLLVLGVNGVNEVDGARHVSAHQTVSFRLLCLNCCGSKSAMTNPYPTFTSADQVSSANTGACSMMRCIMRWCAFVASFPATSLHALPTTSFNDYSSCAAGSSSGAAGAVAWLSMFRPTHLFARAVGAAPLLHRKHTERGCRCQCCVFCACESCSFEFANLNFLCRRC